MNTAQKIAKESTISFIGIFYGSINRYLYSALLARWVGPEYLGIYSMANAIMLIGEVFSKMGMETGTMRFISRLDPKKDQKEIAQLSAFAQRAALDPKLNSQNTFCPQPAMRVAYWFVEH